MDFFKGKLGVPEFLFIEKPELKMKPIWQPARRLHLAFGWCGDVQIELVQPIAGVSTYSKSSITIRKVACTITASRFRYAQGVKDMEARGYSLVQGGRHNETRFAYFDTTGVIGADRGRLSPARGKGLHADAKAKK